MKKIIFIAIAVLGTYTLSAQSKAHYQKLYKQALTYADVTTAASALNNLILLGEESYKDTLAIVYNRSGMYTQSYIVTKELLTKVPASKSLLELQFQNSSQLGALKEAITHVDALILQDGSNPFYLYNKSLLLVQAKDYSNCLQAVNRALELPVNPTDQLTVESSKGGQLAIPIQAELYNIKGLVYYELKDNTGAKDAFNKALQLAPDYKTAATNLAALTKQNEVK